MSKELAQKDIFDEIVPIMMQSVAVVIFLMMLLPSLPIVQSAQRFFSNQSYQGEPDSRTLYATSELQHVVLSNPWVGVYIVNYGPNIVEIKINDESSLPYILNAGETRTLSRVGAENRIYAIYYNCYPGGVATVRADGVY